MKFGDFRSSQLWIMPSQDGLMHLMVADLFKRMGLEYGTSFLQLCFIFCVDSYDCFILNHCAQPIMDCMIYLPPRKSKV
jgi:hypothetical protein